MRVCLVYAFKIVVDGVALAQEASESISLLRGVIHESHRILSAYPDPSTLFTTPTTPPATSSSATDYYSSSTVKKSQGTSTTSSYDDSASKDKEKKWCVFLFFFSCWLHR